MDMVLGHAGMEKLLDQLRADGRRVIGPTVRDGVIALDDVDTLDALPVGHIDRQDAARYRLTTIDSPELFAHAAPSTGWKRFVHPERTLLVRAHRRTDGGIDIDQPEHGTVPVAFFGMRSCDLAALGVLDRVLLDPAATDPTYAAHRADIFIVAVACGHPAASCFCSSMGTGPAPGPGHDLAVTELHDDERHEFLVNAGTDQGVEMLRRLDGRPATDADLVAADTVIAGAVDHMGRQMDQADPARAAEHPDHPQWDDVGARCLACANCTMVCPTCFCSTTEDTTDLTGQNAERWATWDTCFALDFSYLGSGAVRTSTRSRYRQWLMHKLVTWHDQFGTSGCVGCGRCITWCPVGIDLTAEIAALAEAPGGGS